MAGQKREARLRARRPGHPRLNLTDAKNVDARDKPGHDEFWRCGGAGGPRLRLLAVALEYLLTGGTQSLPVLLQALLDRPVVA
jgi:hypothetical protein